jgi:hypothetical protein
MLAAAACATAPSAVVDVTGVWIGDWEFDPASAGGGMLSMTLTQSGTDVRGTVEVTGRGASRPRNFAGVLIGSEIRLTAPFIGTLHVSGNEMTGEINGVLPATLAARRQR